MFSPHLQFYRPCQERGVSLHNNTVYYSAVFLFRGRVARFPPSPLCCLIFPPLFLAKVQCWHHFVQISPSRPFTNLSAQSFYAAAAASRPGDVWKPICALAKSDCDSDYRGHYSVSVDFAPRCEKLSGILGKTIVTRCFYICLFIFFLVDSAVFELL